MAVVVRAAAGEQAAAAMHSGSGSNGATAQQQQHQNQHAPPRQPLPEVIGKRVGIVKRKTKETSVEVRINLDGTGQCIANTPVGFFNHMLDQLASHGLFDVYVEAEGDTWIDDHHTNEDIALALGSALAQVGRVWWWIRGGRTSRHVSWWWRPWRAGGWTGVWLRAEGPGAAPALTRSLELLLLADRQVGEGGLAPVQRLPALAARAALTACWPGHASLPAGPG